MAYRRNQGVSRCCTFQEDVGHPQDPNSLRSCYSFSPADQAIRASTTRPFKGLGSYGDDLGLGEAKSGFWGLLALKAKSILDDDIMMSPTPHTFAQRLHTPQEGRTLVESKTADLRSQIKLKGSDGERNIAKPHTPTNLHETQLKASRDVAMATAAKAKLLLRELKTVKADLAFAKARCAQLEEENKLLRDKEGREKGQHRADDDLIRLQLETLLAEKARLASENEIYSRENRFLREIVEYHEPTMQDVVYLDEGMEQVGEFFPVDSDEVPTVLSLSSPPAELPPPPPHSDLPQYNNTTISSVSQHDHDPAN